MSLLKNLQKVVKTHHVLALLGLFVLGVVVTQYSNRKGNVFDGMSNTLNSSVDSNYQSTSVGNLGNGQQNYPGDVSPAKPVGQNEVFASVSGEMNQSGNDLHQNYSRQPVVNPDELLPKDENSQWAQLNPRGNGELNNVNLLQAGYMYGINTVGSSLRNANLQLRSEPPNPQVQVSPWLNTTIEPDLMRTPLELGTRSQ